MVTSLAKLAGALSSLATVRSDGAVMGGMCLALSIDVCECIGVSVLLQLRCMIRSVLDAATVPVFHRSLGLVPRV